MSTVLKEYLKCRLEMRQGGGTTVVAHLTVNYFCKLESLFISYYFSNILILSFIKLIHICFKELYSTHLIRYTNVGSG